MTNTKCDPPHDSAQCKRCHPNSWPEGDAQYNEVTDTKASQEWDELRDKAAEVKRDNEEESNYHER